MSSQGMVKSILLSLCFWPCLSLAAAGDENWDAQFGIPGNEGYGVGTLAIDANNVYVGGTLTAAGGVAITNIAQWDGKSWSGVGGGAGVGLSEGVGALVLSAGSLYVGGLFSQAGGISAANIARWDGTNWSALGSGVDSVVEALAVDGKNVYAGGQFNSAGGVRALRIARWDGTNWSAFGAITNAELGCVDGCSDDGAVFAMSANGTDLYVGGRFVSAGNVFATNIAKWNGTNWSALGMGLDGYARAIVSERDNVYVAGDFRFAGGLRVNHIARWDGTRWYPVGGGVDDDLSIQALALNGAELYAGGSFGSIGGISARRIAKWDGTNWSALGGGLADFGGGSGVGALAGNGSELFVGGYFPLAGSNPSTNIALWHVPHVLSATQAGTVLTLFWPATGTNFVLEATDSLPGTNWTQVSQQPVAQDNRCIVTHEISGNQKFFRLRRR